MTPIYIANDGTQFPNIPKCFNYEWRNFYPNITAYNEAGDMVSTFDEANIFRVHDEGECQFLIDTLSETSDNHEIEFFRNTSSCSGLFFGVFDPIFVADEDIKEFGYFHPMDNTDLADEMRPHWEE